MAVQQPYLNQALQNWQDRASQYASLGIPQEKWYQLAIHDITNVANTGGQPMSTAQVNAAMLAQVAGQSVVGNPVAHPQSVLGDIGTLFGAVPHDIQGLLSGLIGGTVNFVHHLPSETTATVDYLTHAADSSWLTAHGYQDPTSVGADLRNISKAPLMNLIPGVSDVADLTSGAGRNYLLNHPVTAALDVAPVGWLGRAATAGLEAGEAGSALEALQGGSVVRAGVRGIRDTAAKIPGLASFPPLQREWVANALSTLGLTDQAREIFKLGSVLGRTGTKRLQQAIFDITDQTFKMSPEERAEFFNLAKGIGPHSAELLNGDINYLSSLPDITPQQEALLQNLREVQEPFTQMGQEKWETSRGRDGILVMPYGEGKMVFAADEPAAKIQRNINDVSATQAKYLKARDAQIATVDIREKRLQAAAQSGDNRLIKRLSTQLDNAKNELMRIEARYERTNDDLHQLQTAFQDRLIKTGGPASAHAWVNAEARARFKDIANQNYLQRRDELRQGLLRPHYPGYNPELYAERQKLALENLQQATREIDNATRFKQIRAAIMGPMYERRDLPDPDEEGITKEESKSRKDAIKADAQRETQYNADQVTKAKALYDQTMSDVTHTVLDLISHGFDPIWTRHVETLDRPVVTIHPLPDRIVSPHQWNKKVFNFAPERQDIALGLVAGARELLSHQATEAFINTIIDSHGQSRQSLEADYIRQAELQKDLHKAKPFHPIHVAPVPLEAQRLAGTEWEEIKPATYGLKSFATNPRFAANDTIMIPKWLATNLHYMMPKDVAEQTHRLPLLSSVYDKSLRVFRFSVLTGPRHLVHVAVAGLLPLMMREPGSLTHLASAWRLIHEGNAPIELTKNLYTFETDHIYNYATGHQLGSWAKQAWEATGQKLEQRLAKIEEMASDIYRVSAYLSMRDRGFMDKEAIATANKVAIDMDDMAPWERTIIKQVFPFYAFTRFLFRYLLSYPIDHPFRVSILSRFSTQEQEEWNSLLPTKFMQMLWIGKPDAHGNILTIDYKNLNPFRSFSNDFTMVGFFQSLNPVLSAPFAARGFSTITGVGDLYPQVSFNPQTGSLVAAAPSGVDQIFNVLQQFTPELGAVDHFLGITDQMRLLKKSNPQEYRALLFSSLNIPFAPVTVNQPYVEEKTEADRYQAASAAASNAEKTGNWQQALQYANVPYQGQYYSPEDLEAYWNGLIQQLDRSGESGVDPRALIATPIHRTSQDPLELLQAEQGNLQLQSSTRGM
jgi:hypothetical protein